MRLTTGFTTSRERLKGCTASQPRTGLACFDCLPLLAIIEGALLYGGGDAPGWSAGRAGGALEVLQEAGRGALLAISLGQHC